MKQFICALCALLFSLSCVFAQDNLTVKTEKAPLVSVVSSETTSVNVIEDLKRQGSGIYYQATDGTVQPLESISFSRIKEGEALTRMFPTVSTNKIKMAINGESSNFQFSSVRPKFYFFFSQEEKSLNNQMVAASASSATSPNDFVLIKFDVKKKVRQVVSGSTGATEFAGVENRQRQPCRFKRIEPGVYEIYFNEDLKPGEYGFMYAAVIAGSNLNPKVYDFGIEKK